MKGFRVKGPAGIGTVDPSYQTMGLRASGTIDLVTRVPASTNLTAYYANLVLPGDAPFLAIRCQTSVFISSSGRDANGNWTYLLYCINNTTTVEWYLFDRTNYALQAPGNKGLRVRNPANGNVVFDSRMRTLRVLDFYQLVGDRGSNAVSPNYDNTWAGKKVAVVQSARPWQSATTVNPGAASYISVYTSAMMQTPGTERAIVNFQQVGVRGGSGDGSGAYGNVNNRHYSSYTFVDVTGY